MDIKQKMIEAMREAPMAFVDNSDLGDLVFTNMLDAALVAAAENYSDDDALMEGLFEEMEMRELHGLRVYASDVVDHFLAHLRGLPA